jgi:hypothetical protein
MVQDFFGQLSASVDTIHNLNGPVGIQVVGAILNPPHETGGLICEPNAEQRVQSEGGVANPRVPVVPVALAAHFFGKTARGSRDNCSRWFESQQFQRQRGALYHFPPPALVGGFGEPSPPILYSSLEQIIGLQLGKQIGVAFGPRSNVAQHKGHHLPLSQGEPSYGAFGYLLERNGR